MKMNLAIKLIPVCLVLLLCANWALAGFGISPPYVINDRLVPGTVYEQKISMSRSDVQEDLKVQITVDAPEIQSWLSFDKGTEFVFPKGEKQADMTVKVSVPEDAVLKNYKGYIRVRVVPLEAVDSGQVAVALGARIDVDLLVGNGEIFDFLVRFINILKSESKAWPLSYFDKIKISLRIENTGNIESSPTRVHLDVYDSLEKNILESSDQTELEKIKPFETKEIFVQFPTRLEPGTYYGVVSVYKNEEISRREKIIFDVEKTSFSLRDWLIVVGAFVLILMILGLIALTILKIRRKNRS